MEMPLFLESKINQEYTNQGTLIFTYYGYQII